MEKNVGGTDRKTRFALGALLTLAGIAGYAGIIPVATSLAPQALTSVILVLVGLILIATGYTRKCMINSVLNRNTYKEE